MSKTTGGPAFPTSRQVPSVEKAYFNMQTRQTTDAQGNPVQYQLVQEGGLTLRDYFMVHAPRGEIADMCPIDQKGCAEIIGIPTEAYTAAHYPQVLAKLRGMWADAMIAERERE